MKTQRDLETFRAAHPDMNDVKSLYAFIEQAGGATKVDASALLELPADQRRRIVAARNRRERRAETQQSK